MALWPWGLWPWSGLLIGSGLCGPWRRREILLHLGIWSFAKSWGSGRSGRHFAWGFPMIFMMRQFDCEGWKLQVAWHYKTRDTQDSSDVLWNDDRWLLKFDKSKWDLSQLKVDCVIKSRCSCGIIHECIWSWEDGKVCELKSAAMIPWISVADENTKEVWKGVVELSNQTNLVI